MHRILAIGLAASFALAFSATAAAWSWPADGTVLRPFSLGADAYAAGQHRGIDVAGPEGSAVRAPAGGVVTFAGSLPTYGRGVTIQTGDGYAVTLVHLGEIGVAKGDTVSEGAVVGTMGSSGTPEHAVPSVHLGVRLEADEEGYVDPLGLLPPRAEPVPTPAPEPVPAPVSAPAAAPAAQQPPPAPPSPATPVTPPSTPAVTPPPTVSPPTPVSAPSVTGGTAAGSHPTPQPAVAATAASAVDGPAAQVSPGPGVEIVAAAPVAKPIASEAGGEIHVSATAGVSAHAPAHPSASPALGTSTVTPSRDASTRVAPRRATVVHDDAVAPRVAAPHGPIDRPTPTEPAGGHPTTRALVHEALSAPGLAKRDGPVAPAHADRADTGWQEFLATRAPDEKHATLARADLAGEPQRGVAGKVARLASHAGRGALETIAALALAVLLAASVGQRVARRIGMDGAVLRHHADLLRQLDAAHRPRLHDRGRGRVRAPSTAART
ncbi:MAG TPA: peptidoglycan DD-metalloendopeptidase family protein [Gaiella sp.]|nr:peptidoglycan DD-metalloendopeptidase family protein [Gaiella sp.]